MTNTQASRDTRFQNLHSRFIKMADSIGVDATITQLHLEIGKLEPKIFDDGFDKERFEEVQYLRELSRELWTKRFQLNSDTTKE